MIHLTATMKVQNDRRTEATCLLKLEFHRSRIERGDGICHVVTDSESLLPGLPRQVDEERIGVSIHDPGTPLLGGVDCTNRLPRIVSTAL